jgi:hypothetical protein
MQMLSASGNEKGQSVPSCSVSRDWQTAREQCCFQVLVLQSWYSLTALRAPHRRAHGAQKGLDLGKPETRTVLRVRGFLHKRLFDFDPVHLDVVLELVEVVRGEINPVIWGHSRFAGQVAVRGDVGRGRDVVFFQDFVHRPAGNTRKGQSESLTVVLGDVRTNRDQG